MEGATAVASAENLGCGDVLKVWVRVEGGVVTAATFQARGCTATVACGSALTEWLGGKSLATLGFEEVVAGVEAAVDGLPAASRHAARLCGEVVRGLLE